MDLERTRKLLIAEEASKKHVYKDSRGIWTIGVGRNVQEHSGPGLRQEEIEFMLQCDLRDYQRELAANIAAWEMLSDARQAVLISMRHNLGLQGLLGFKEMLKALNAGDFQRAASEMLRSEWEAQLRPKSPKIQSRPAKLARMMDSGQWPDHN